MKILLTNDDGYRARSYQLLGQALQKEHEVHLIGPEGNCSGISHAFTLHHPVYIKPVPPHENPLGLKNFYTFYGTPVDCVKYSLTTFFDKDSAPDLVISGINYGANVATDVLYSGTIAAAVEGYVNGWSAIAISYFESGLEEKRIQEMIAWFLPFLKKTEGFIKAEKRLLNINYPDLDPDKIKGVRITEVGNRGFTNSYQKRASPSGRDYFWLQGEMDFASEKPSSDKMAIKDGYISVSPMKIDYTHLAEFDLLQRVLEKK